MRFLACDKALFFCGGKVGGERGGKKRGEGKKERYIFPSPRPSADFRAFVLSRSEKNSAWSQVMRFQKSPLLKPFSKVSVFISFFGRFSVVDRRKRIKMYVFSNENALVRQLSCQSYVNNNRIRSDFPIIIFMDSFPQEESFGRNN